MARTFMVYVNVDELNASLVGLFTAQEKAEWVSGFQAGCVGVQAGQGWSDTMLRGHAVGFSAYQTSESYRTKKSLAGAASAQVRKEKHGTAQPQTQNSARTVLEQCSNNVRTATELSNIQYPIENIEKRVSNAQDSTQELFDQIVEHDRKLSERVASQPVAYSWQDWRIEHPQIAVGRTGEDGDPKAWRDLWTHYDGRECFDAMYTALTRNLPEGRKVWYGQAAEWLNKNTQDV